MKDLTITLTIKDDSIAERLEVGKTLWFDSNFWEALSVCVITQHCIVELKSKTLLEDGSVQLEFTQSPAWNNSL
jgi:hypothetical protein